MLLFHIDLEGNSGNLVGSYGVFLFFCSPRQVIFPLSRCYWHNLPCFVSVFRFFIHFLCVCAPHRSGLVVWQNQLSEARGLFDSVVPPWWNVVSFRYLIRLAVPDEARIMSICNKGALHHRKKNGVCRISAAATFQ